MQLSAPQAGQGHSGVARLREFACGLIVLAAALLVLVFAPSAHGAVGDLVFRACLAESVLPGCATAASLDGAVDVVVNPAGSSVYVASDTDDSITAFVRKPAGDLVFHSCFALGGASGCAPQDTLDGATGVAVSPDGASVFVASASGNSLTSFRRAAAGGLVLDNSFTSSVRLTGASGVTVSPDGASVYVAARTAGTINHLTRSAGGGLNLVACHSDEPIGGCTSASSLAGAYSVAVSPDGSSVYAASSVDDAITHFARGPAGALTFRGCYDNGTTGSGCTPIGSLDGARDVAVSADGSSVYAVAVDGDALTHFARDAAGALTFRGCFDEDNPGCTPIGSLDGARSVDVSPDGASVYVVSVIDDALTIFSRDAAGALAFRGCLAAGGASGCAPVGSLDVAAGVAVSPDGSSVYVAANHSDAITQFSRELAAGSPGTPGGGGGPVGSVPAPPGVRCNGRQATLLAAGPLTRGTARADVIVGRAGKDRILGLGGADLICGRGGADRLEGGAGPDLLIGEAGADVLLGGLGVDVLRGGAGRDRLTGGPGRDRLLGGPGLDWQRQ